MGTIYKRLAIALPDPEAGDEMPVLVSPDVRAASPCPDCPAALARYTPLRYLVPGETRAQHFHERSGGIYCLAHVPYLCDHVLAEGESVGRAVGGPGGIRADAVRLTRLLRVPCVGCRRDVGTGEGRLVFGVKPGPIVHALCERHRGPSVWANPPTGWGFVVREGRLVWTRPARAAA